MDEGGLSIVNIVSFSLLEIALRILFVNQGSELSL